MTALAEVGSHVEPGSKSGWPSWVFMTNSVDNQHNSSNRRTFHNAQLLDSIIRLSSRVLIYEIFQNASTFIFYYPHNIPMKKHRINLNLNMEKINATKALSPTTYSRCVKETDGNMTWQKDMYFGIIQKQDSKLSSTTSM